NHDPHHAQVVGERQLRVLRAGVSRSAVNATVVAPVSDAHPEIGDVAPVFVAKPHAFGNVTRKEGQGRVARSGSFPKYGRPGHFSPNPCPCTLQGAATPARYACGRTWSEP